MDSRPNFLIVILDSARPDWLSCYSGPGGVSPNIDRVAAGSVTSVTFIGWGVGAPLIGWLSDRIGNRRRPLIAGLIVSASSLSAILYLPGIPLWAVGVLCFGIGFGGSRSTRSAGWRRRGAGH